MNLCSHLVTFPTSVPRGRHYWYLLSGDNPSINYRQQPQLAAAKQICLCNSSRSWDCCPRLPDWGWSHLPSSIGTHHLFMNDYFTGINSRERKYFQIIDMNVGRRCTLISCKSPEDDVKFKDKYGQNKFFAWGLFTMFAVGCYQMLLCLIQICMLYSHSSMLSWTKLSTGTEQHRIHNSCRVYRNDQIRVCEQGILFSNTCNV